MLREEFFSALIRNLFINASTKIEYLQNYWICRFMTLHENYIWKKSSTYMNLHNNISAKVQNQCKKVPANHGDSSILSQQKKLLKKLGKKNL